MHEPPLILIVDDDAQLVDLFTTKLETVGFAVRKAYDGKEGYELAKQLRPDLVLLDLKMPVWDGVQTLAKIRSDDEIHDTKVIILSSFNDWSTMKLDQKSARAIGAIDFIEKGIDLNELVAKLRTLLNYHPPLSNSV